MATTVFQLYLIILSYLFTCNIAANDDTDADIELYTTISWIIISIILLIAISLLIISFFYDRRFKGSDNTNYIGLTLYLISIIDFLTNILFFGILLVQKHLLTLYCFVFLFIPHIFSIIIGILYIIRWKKQKQKQKSAWIQQYSSYLIIFSLFSNFYTSIELCNSILFHLNIFNMQILNNERQKIQLISIIFDVFLLSFPSMIIQMAYMSFAEYSQISIAAISMLFSFISIAIGIFIVVSKLCNGLVELLIPQNDNNINNNQEKQENLIIKYDIQMLCKSHELNVSNNKHYLFSHKLIKKALCIILQITSDQCVVLNIDKLSHNDIDNNNNNNHVNINTHEGIKCHIRILPSIHDENIFILLELLESPKSGIYDLLKQEICKLLYLNDIDNLKLIIKQVNDINSSNNNNNNNNNQQTWKCAACTFENHYALKQCEVCQSIKIPDNTNNVLLDEQDNININIDIDEDEDVLPKDIDFNDVDDIKNIAIDNDDNDNEKMVFKEDNIVNNNNDDIELHQRYSVMKRIIDDNNKLNNKKQNDGVYTGDPSDSSDDNNVADDHDDVNALIGTGIPTKGLVDAILEDVYVKQTVAQDINLNNLNIHNLANDMDDDDNDNNMNINNIGSLISKIAISEMAPSDLDIAISVIDENEDEKAEFDDDDQVLLANQQQTNLGVSYDPLADDFDALRENDVFG